jgi:hypothetical protein
VVVAVSGVVVGVVVGAGSVVVVAPGVVSTGVVSTGVVSTGVAVAGAVVVGVIGVVQSAVRRFEDAEDAVAGLFAGAVDAVGVEAFAFALAFAVEFEVVVELVWPSMRCSTGSVAESCTVPSIRSVVVRSPCLTVAVLKIDGSAADAVSFGLRTAIA